MSNYYLYENGAVVGPFPAEELKARQLPDETQVCAEGTQDWTLVGEIEELKTVVPPPLPPPLPPMAPGPTLTPKKKIFIIHGRGNTMDDAFGRLIGLIRVKLRYYQAGYYVDAENSNFARYILYDTHENPFLQQLDRILVGKIALSPAYPPPSDWKPDESWTLLSEFKLRDKLNLHGMPLLGGARRKWADALFPEIWRDFGALIGESITSQPALAEALHNLRMRLRPTADGLYLETEYKEAIRKLFAEKGLDPEPFVAALLELQRLNDAGGDLDTIASNALYGAWLQQAWQEQFGQPPLYGRDYGFDFVNYQQSFMHLAKHRDCEVYLPDFPMDAIPDLEESARALIANNSFYVRIDDHHPLPQEKLDLLARLKQEGLIGEYFQSGPVKGGPEQPESERTCGADLVHRFMLAGTRFDNPGLDELRRLAHMQDLGLIANPDDRTHPDYLAVDLSKLIGSKYSRIDMVQQLMQVRSFEQMRDIMNLTGWRQVVDNYEAQLEETLPKLDANCAMIEYYTAEEAAEARPLLGALGSIARLIDSCTLRLFGLENAVLGMKRPLPAHRIFITLAPFQSRKEHRINIASALNYSKRHFRFDYFFYAWGSSLLSTRRFNREDETLNLSELMPILGGPADGGHPSAATCKPPSNENWPAEEFEKLNYRNFLSYCRYLAKRISEGKGVRILSVRSLGKKDRDY